MNRESLEIKMTEMLDSGSYSKADESQLLEELRQYPDLAEAWELMRSGPVSISYDAVYPLEPVRNEDLEPIREALSPTTDLTTELLQWFPRYFAAAALMLLFLAGYFTISSGQSESFEGQVSEWIYLFGEEEQLQNQEFLVQELPFTFDYND